MLKAYSFEYNKKYFIALEYGAFRYVISDIRKFHYEEASNQQNYDVAYHGIIQYRNLKGWDDLFEKEIMYFGVLTYLHKALEYIKSVDLNTLAKREYLQIGNEISLKNYELSKNFDIASEVVCDCFKITKHTRCFENSDNNRINDSKIINWYEVFVGINQGNNDIGGFYINSLKEQELMVISDFVDLFTDRLATNT